MKKFLSTALLTVGLTFTQTLAYAQDTTSLPTPQEASLAVSADGRYEIPGVGGNIDDRAEAIEADKVRVVDEGSPVSSTVTTSRLPVIEYSLPTPCGSEFVLLCITF